MKPKAGSATVLFDVFYKDGGRSSNRKVPTSVVNGPDGDAPARRYIEAQERQIAEKSGIAPRHIERVVRSAA
jgi:hypothetical protein